MTMAVEQRAARLKEYAAQYKPGLLTCFPGSFAAYAPRAVTMIEKLVKRRCPPEIAEQLAVLVLFDLVLLLGTYLVCIAELATPRRIGLSSPFIRRQ